MPISFIREKCNRGVPLGTLKVGDAFLYENRVGIIVDRNGHTFPIDLNTCGLFRHNPYCNAYTYEISPETIVLPIDIEVRYKVVE